MSHKDMIEKKKKTVDELGNIFQSNGVYMFDYRGLTVTEMEDLRSRVKGFGANLKVIKNRMAVKYFEREKREQGRDLFKGPLAVAYANDSFVDVAKVMVNYAKENSKIDIIAGFIEQTFGDAEKIKIV